MLAGSHCPALLACRARPIATRRQALPFLEPLPGRGYKSTPIPFSVFDHRKAPPPPFLLPPIDGEASARPSIASSQFFSPPSVLTSPPTFLCRDPHRPTTGAPPKRLNRHRRAHAVSSQSPATPKWNPRATLALVARSAGTLATGSVGSAGPPPLSSVPRAQASARWGRGPSLWAEPSHVAHERPACGLDSTQRRF
jgi:hypothetical protein